jgi:tRNA threonylcarbamoyl adenosine modification protein (Sua5/YciO/YrdC/YwlC family)
MATIISVHPDNPQSRAVTKIAELMHAGAIVAYPTYSGYSLGCLLDNKQGIERIRKLRQIKDKNDFTVVCADFSQVGKLAQLTNSQFRHIKAATPNQYTFILNATKEVNKFLLSKRKTIGIRIPNHPFILSLLKELGAPIASASLIFEGERVVMSNPEEINDKFGRLIEIIVDTGESYKDPTTIVEWTGLSPKILRYGSGDPEQFE